MLGCFGGIVFDCFVSDLPALVCHVFGVSVSSVVSAHSLIHQDEAGFTVLALFVQKCRHVDPILGPKAAPDAPKTQPPGLAPSCNVGELGLLLTKGLLEAQGQGPWAKILGPTFWPKCLADVLAGLLGRFFWPKCLAELLG